MDLEFKEGNWQLDWAIESGPPPSRDRASWEDHRSHRVGNPFPLPPGHAKEDDWRHQTLWREALQTSPCLRRPSRGSGQKGNAPL